MYGGYSFPSWLFVTLLHFSRYRSNRSSPSTSSMKLQNFQGISDILSEVSKFQHHTNLWPECSSLLVFSLVKVQLAGEKSLLLVERCFFHGNPGLITCTSCNICCHELLGYTVHQQYPALYFQVMQTTLKNVELLKHFKIRKLLQHVSVYKETIIREPQPVLS